MAVPTDPNSGMPLDPATLQALQQQQLNQRVQATGGTSAERLNDLSSSTAVSSLFPSAQVQEANKVQQAMKSAAVTQNQGESDLDFSVRQLRAQRDAVAPADPNAASQMNIQLLKLGQMQFEQQRLKASDQREQTKFDEGEPERKAAELHAQATGSLGYAITQDPKAELGYHAQAFDLSDPSQSAAYTTALKNGATPFSADKAAALFASSNTADMKMAGELARANMTINSGKLPADALPQLAVESIFAPENTSRLSGAARAQIAEFKTQTGITPVDELGAKMQIKAIGAAASAEGRRDGNITLLAGSMDGMGKQVLNNLDGVSRTSFTYLNGAIAAGKSVFSDPGEKAYAGAIQSFVNEYARVINGGTGQSSDSSRKEAWSLLTKQDGPAGVKAAVLQLGQRETQVIRDAGDQAVEMLANPSKYPALVKIQAKAGIQLTQNQPDQEAAQNKPPITITGPDDFNKLPPGAKYIFNGVTLVKGAK